MRKAVFGGTFDPPHNGHIMIASAVISAKLADRVLFVPAFNPPHKQDRKISAYSHRLRMLQLALEGFPLFEISEIEAEQPEKPSYTLNTMRELAKKYPETEFVLLIGSDGLRQLHTWHNAAELIDEFDFIVYPRPGELPTEKELASFWPPERASYMMSRILKMPFSGISSSEIRQMIFKNKSVDNLINHRVKCYIYGSRIYF